MDDMSTRAIGDGECGVGDPASLTITSRTTPRTAAVIRLSKSSAQQAFGIHRGDDDRIMTPS